MQPFEPSVTTAELPPTGGRIGDAPEHFVVEEIPAYEPCGEGEHVYLWVEKRQHNTRDVARILARAAGVQERDVGFAGMKDRQAVTRQWFSLPPGAQVPETWPLPEGICVLAHSRHKNKLRTGHLIGNRFEITLVDLAEGGPERAEAIAARLRERGCSNAFGPQRFGRGGQNLARAWEWLLQEASPGQPAGTERRQSRRLGRRGPDPKLLSSVIQSEIFNRYLERRLQTGKPLLHGEVVRLNGTGSHFVVEDATIELPRYLTGDLRLTGPMVGPKTLQAKGPAHALEEEILAELGLTPELLSALARHAPGTRRDLLLLPEQLVVSEHPGELRLSFTLPAGAFATQLVREFTHAPWDTPRSEHP